ncbi:hypothetical protein LUZ60_011374 [Juncus effusus]|nr:hypothetical protein LUZ60_011374 [Juncus effusus]
MASWSRAASSLPNPNLSLSGRRIAFTSPSNYSIRLSRLLELHGATPLPIPTISVGPTPSTLRPALSSLDSFSALAFTSRTGISSFSLALSSSPPPPLSASGHAFIVAALGTDAELLQEGEPCLLEKLCANSSRIRLLVPDTATPCGMIECLGNGGGRKILCPVPVVVGLTEPPVIPCFLAGLEGAGWIPVSVASYKTRWAGPECVSSLVELKDELDAIVFTSSAEVEGFLKGLDAVGWSWENMKGRWPELLVAAHGPVTAKGVESFGLNVDVVSRNCSSFAGVLDALSSQFDSLH